MTDEYDYRFKLESAKELDEVVEVLQKAFEAAKGVALEAADMDVAALSRQVMTKAVVKRMKLTKTGKVKFHHAFTSHIMVRRSTKRKRTALKLTPLCVSVAVLRVALVVPAGGISFHAPHASPAAPAATTK